LTVIISDNACLISNMIKSSLIPALELAANLINPNWAIVDCRFSLGDIDVGRKEYERAHIPGAVYAHLDHDLSGEIVPGITGRHPLPDPDLFALTLGRWGIGANTQVVVYDDAGGDFAVRLWWMLKWLGHEAVVLLDGGWTQWKKLNLPEAKDIEIREEDFFKPAVNWDMVADVEEVDLLRLSLNAIVVDSRSKDRFRGENETIDPIAGHIPGAVCLPYQDNLNSEGLFLSKDELKLRFKTILGDIPADESIFYCGSGVSAAHNLFAMTEAGFPMGRLYAGSWSEWIVDPLRPVGTS
jgi:thiosulfate/3-mercaptopyruvate sulfurtransferase